jgi:hypothetical protein
VTSAECGPRVLVQAPIGMPRAKALIVESMCFTTFTLARSLPGGDSILAAVQILTWDFIGRMRPWSNAGVSILNSTAQRRATARRLGFIMPARRDRACFALWSNSEDSTVTREFQVAAIALRRDHSLQ